mgnify:CR=1 FL=1
MGNLWDERFNQNQYVYGTEPNPFVKQIIHRLKGKRLLTIAEGEGRNAVFLAEHGFQVTAWDYSKVGLEKTKALAKQRGVHVHTELVDLERVQWKENEWDLIINIWGHISGNQKAGLLQGIAKAIKPGGMYATEVYSVHQLDYKTGGPSSREMLYAPEDILHNFPNWKYLHFYYGEATRNEGALHTGLSHVIQALIQKEAAPKQQTL